MPRPGRYLLVAGLLGLLALQRHLGADASLCAADDAALPAAVATRRRQNDRMETLAGGVAPAKNNFPAVYQRLLAAEPGAWPASRRWLHVGLPNLAAFNDVAGNGVPTALSGKLAVKPGVAMDAVHPGTTAAPSPLASLVENRFTLPAGAAPTNLALGGLGAAAQRQNTKRLKMRQKIAKFLNLFTVVQFSNDACEAPTVGLTGTCFHHMQCRSLGGHPGGACAQGYGVCCLFEKTCGGTTRLNSTYFVSSPAALEDADARDSYVDCFITVEKLQPDVTQLRLDFLHFELAAPTEGTCLEERFVVISPDRNAPTPALCGTNNGQHMYVQVGNAGATVRLGVQWRAGAGAGRAPRWVVRLTQLRAHDEGAAPAGCLQYHAGHAGLVQSFGYLGPGPGSYTNNLNYAVCIRKEAGFCSLTYSTEVVNGTAMPFQLLNVDQDGAPTIPPGQAGAEVFNCPSDYIAVNGIRLCGERLNDASLDQDYTHDSPVTDSGSGPFVLPVRTDGNLTGRGFSLSYRQIACSDARDAATDTAAPL